MTTKQVQTVPWRSRIVGSGEEAPTLLVTDPPYGVSYDATWRDGVYNGMGPAERPYMQLDGAIWPTRARQRHRGAWAAPWAHDGPPQHEHLRRHAGRLVEDPAGVVLRAWGRSLVDRQRRCGRSGRPLTRAPIIRRAYPRPLVVGSRHHPRTRGAAHQRSESGSSDAVGRRRL